MAGAAPFSCCKAGLGVRALPVPITAAAAAPAARLVWEEGLAYILKDTQSKPQNFYEF